jgi:ATP-dependent protease ClpP protease subunit
LREGNTLRDMQLEDRLKPVQTIVEGIMCSLGLFIYKSSEKNGISTYKGIWFV